MVSLSIVELMARVRAERDRMSAALDGAQEAARNDLKVVAEDGDGDEGYARVLDRYRTYIARSDALISRYEAEAS